MTVRSVHVLTLVLVLPILAGCVAEPPAAPTTAAPPADERAAAPVSPVHALVLPPITGAIAGTPSLSEPTIDISPTGRIFVTAIPGIVIGGERVEDVVPNAVTRSPIFELVDGAWVQRGTNAERQGEIGGGDADLEFDALGRVYHTDLWLGNDGIAVSEDGIDFFGSPISHYFAGSDRQWFAHFGSKYLYLITNHLALGAVSYRADIDTPLGEKGGVMSSIEVPILCRCGPPGFPAVDSTGYLFVPLAGSDFSGNNAAGLVGGIQGVRVFRSVNGGVQFNAGVQIPGSGAPVHFAVAAVDESRNVYVAWASEAADGTHDVWLSRSTNRGLAFSAPILVSTASGTHLFPWLVAGEAGKVAVVWYGTDVVADPNDLDAMADAEWRVHYAESTNALAATPTFTTWDLSGPMHEGTVSTQGFTSDSATGQGPDRSLGDFFSAALDPTTGKVWVAYVNNHPSTPAAQRGVWVQEMPAGASTLT